MITKTRMGHQLIYIWSIHIIIYILNIQLQQQ